MVRCDTARPCVRDNAFQPHAADMVEYRRAVGRHMLNEADGAPLAPAEQGRQPPLATDQRLATQVVAVKLQQVEGVEHHSMTIAARAQGVEVRAAVIADNDCLAIDQERSGVDAAGSVNDSGEAVGPVVAVTCEAADPRAIPAQHQPVAVVLDFVNPLQAGRRRVSLGRTTGVDEAGRRRINRRPSAPWESPA